MTFADLRFADPIIFCGFKTSLNPHIHNFSLYKYMLKMLSFKFKVDFWLLGVKWHFVVLNILRR